MLRYSLENYHFNNIKGNKNNILIDKGKVLKKNLKRNM